MRVLALDYGAARTGVAVSDSTGTIARPLGVVRRAMSDAGLRELAALAARYEVRRVVVGLPLTLGGEHGEQARETLRFVDALRELLDVPVETFDERFTTVLAAAAPAPTASQEDARAAAHLLQGWLERTGSA